jgi:glycerophosphoryl diester phosphodiesterase
LPEQLRIIGHRGASAHAPENTISAFKLALEHGAHGIEFDVRLTRDGVPVVIHDATLKRTGGRNLRVNELTLNELKSFEVGSWFPKKNFAGEPLPTLQSVFELFSSNDSLLYLEMKSEASERQQLAQACCRAIKENGLESRVIVESFDLPAIECVKKIEEQLKTAALFEPSFATPPLMASKRIVEAARAVGANEIALHHRLAGTRNVRTALDGGFAVVVWTVNSPEWTRRAQDLGVATLITNDPAVLLSAL